MKGNLKELGGKIRTARKDKFSLTQFAKLLGISKSYLSVLERGENPRTGEPSRPKKETILQIADLLSLNREELLKLAGYEYKEEIPGVGLHLLLRVLQKDLEKLSDRIFDVQHQLSLHYGRSPLLKTGWRRVVEEVSLGDHLLFLSKGGKGKEEAFKWMKDFIEAGVKSRWQEGVAVFPPDDKAEEMRSYENDRVQIVTPDEDREVYKEGETIEKGAREQFFKLASHFRQRGLLLGRYVMYTGLNMLKRYLGEFLSYEHHWPEDMYLLTGIHPPVLLCFYDYEGLENIILPHGEMEFVKAVVSLLLAHNRLIYISEEEGGQIRVTWDVKAALELSDLLMQKIFKRDPTQWCEISPYLYQVNRHYAVWDEEKIMKAILGVLTTSEKGGVL